MMAPVSKRRQFQALVAVLAAVEERKAISVADAAELVGFSQDALRPLLEQVLFLEFKDTIGQLISRAESFLLDERGVLCITDEHWLRNLGAVPPSSATALRLLVACTVVRALSDGAQPALDAAMSKLEQLVAADVVVPVDRPAHLTTCERARHLGRTLHIRYVKDADSEPSDREIEPWSVLSNWGKWYVHGLDRDDLTAKWFRVDRIVHAEVGTTEFDPPVDECDFPELFDLDEHARTVTVYVDRSALDVIASPYRFEVTRTVEAGGGTHGDDRVEARITVFGERRLDNLLLVLPAGTQIVGDPDLAERRRALAAGLLEHYR